MVRWIFIGLTLCSALAVSRISSDAELRKLARFPVMRNSEPIHFDRHFGFAVFPDRDAVVAAAAKLVRREGDSPPAAEAHLQAGRLLEFSGNEADAYRAYSRAADQLRREIERSSDDADLFAMLADALGALGRFTEAQSWLQRARQLGPETAKVCAAEARVNRERAWRKHAGEASVYSGQTVIQVLEQLQGSSVPSETASEIKESLEAADQAYARLIRFEAADDALAERAAFLSLKTAMLDVLSTARGDQSRARPVLQSLANAAAIDQLNEAAKMNGDPSLTAAAVMTSFLAGAKNVAAPPSVPYPASASAGMQRLDDFMRGDHPLTAADAAEVRGCVQFFLLQDFEGSERSLRKALGQNPKSVRAWDMLFAALSAQQKHEELIQLAEDRVAAVGDLQSRLVQVRAYDLAGDLNRARLAAIGAQMSSPNDFLANMALASLLSKGSDHADFAWKIQECLSKAERALSMGATVENRADLGLAKAIFHALNGEPEKARAAFESVPARSREMPEFQELKRLLGW